MQIIFGLLLLWVILIAVGTVVFGNTVESGSWRKPAVVLLPMLTLLGGWAWLLKRRSTSVTKQ